MTNEILAHIKRIKEASNKNNLIIFVGAGVSKNSNVPDWNQLIETFKKELPENIEEDRVKIAQLYKNSRGYNEYIQKVRTELGHGTTNFNPIHSLILDLNPIHIVTT
jgi:NAD-dependent SIR2 family protein deacetylase